LVARKKRIAGKERVEDGVVLWWWLKCYGVVWDELELFRPGDLHVILIFFSLDSSIVFLAFKL
jgi:hypothetical protein